MEELAMNFRSRALKNARANYRDAVLRAKYPSRWAQEQRIAAAKADNIKSRVHFLQLAAYWQSIADAQLRAGAE
jgi:hypothetical protein